MSNELNPCPYCGGAGAQIDTRVDELSYVVCSCCGAFGPSGIGADGATAAWNHRVTAERLVDANKSSQPNPPLTLEELRGMGGEPVWIEDWWQNSKGWELSDDAGDYFSEHDTNQYGKWWIAYRHKPEEE